jgi:ABC-type sugar transport system permease subunit
MNSTSTTAGRQTAEVRFALAWIVLVAAGFIVGLAVGLPISWAISEPLVRSLGETAGRVLSVVVFSAVFGLSIGVAQAIALRGRSTSPFAWLLGSITGSVVAAFVFAILLGNRSMPEAAEVMGLVAGSLIGLGMGIGQWLAARGLAHRMAWWPIMSAAGLLAGWVTTFSLANDDMAAPAVILGGLLTAAFTGLGMRWLLRE